jgi:cell division protein FtsL
MFAISLLGFYLPIDSGEKVSFETTILLALVVFLLMVGEKTQKYNILVYTHSIQLKIYNYYNQPNHKLDNYYFHLIQLHRSQSYNDHIQYHLSRFGS